MFDRGPIGIKNASEDVEVLQEKQVGLLVLGKVLEVEFV